MHRSLIFAFALLLALCASGAWAQQPDAATLEAGKKLYATAGACIACHMIDGKGMPGSIPPLVKSDWIKGKPDRMIAIVLRGMQGPVLVNGQKFYSTMPPQALFDEKQLALIMTYVNNAFGNKGPVITADQVAKAKKSLPQTIYSPQTLLKAFPFDKNDRKKNGTFKPDYDDQLFIINEPVVYRTFMPGASPAAFAVALPGNHFYCWDAGECRLRYVWTKGGFIKGNQRHWSSNGKPVAEFYGFPYYRARSSLLKAEQYKDLAKTNMGAPFYDTSQARDFPIRFEGGTSADADALPRFKGYRLIKGYPEFWYTLNGREIRELITPTHPKLGATKEKRGIIRRFKIDSGGRAVVLRLTASPECILTTTAGKIEADGTLKLSAKQAKDFSVTILEKNPPLPLGASSAGGSTKGGDK